jgi:hypothetical protein
LNLSEPYDEWWCCLNPRERSAISLLTAAWFSNNEYITQSAYTIIAFTSGLAALTLVNAFFIAHYGLTEGFIFPEEEPPVPVLFFDSELWPLLYEFAFSENYLCTDPCKAFEFWT